MHLWTGVLLLFGGLLVDLLHVHGKDIHQQSDDFVKSMRALKALYKNKNFKVNPFSPLGHEENELRQVLKQQPPPPPTTTTTTTTTAPTTTTTTTKPTTTTTTIPPRPGCKCPLGSRSCVSDKPCIDAELVWAVSTCPTTHPLWCEYMGECVDYGDECEECTYTPLPGNPLPCKIGSERKCAKTCKQEPSTCSNTPSTPFQCSGTSTDCVAYSAECPRPNPQPTPAPTPPSDCDCPVGKRAKCAIKGSACVASSLDANLNQQKCSGQPKPLWCPHTQSCVDYDDECDECMAFPFQDNFESCPPGNKQKCGKPCVKSTLPPTCKKDPKKPLKCPAGSKQSGCVAYEVECNIPPTTTTTTATTATTTTAATTTTTPDPCTCPPGKKSKCPEKGGGMGAPACQPTSLTKGQCQDPQEPLWCPYMDFCVPYGDECEECTTTSPPQSPKPCPIGSVLKCSPCLQADLPRYPCQPKDPNKPLACPRRSLKKDPLICVAYQAECPRPPPPFACDCRPGALTICRQVDEHCDATNLPRDPICTDPKKPLKCDYMDKCVGYGEECKECDSNTRKSNPTAHFSMQLCGAGSMRMCALKCVDSDFKDSTQTTAAPCDVSKPIRCPAGSLRKKPDECVAYEVECGYTRKILCKDTTTHAP